MRPCNYLSRDCYSAERSRWCIDCDTLIAIDNNRGAEMQKSKDLTLQLAGTFALAILVGTSSFAEARHLGGTRGGGSSRQSSPHQSFGRGIVSRPHFSSGFGRSAPRVPSGPRVAPRAPYAGRSVAPRGPSNYYGRGRGGVGRSYRGGSFYNSGSR